MAWRGLHISRPATLRLAARRLEVEQDGEKLGFPLEDLAWVILDTPQVTVTAAAMAACMGEGVPLVVSDERHLPCGVLLPFHQHYRQAGVMRAQLAATAAVRKRLWTAIVRAKIRNQAAALRPFDRAGAATLVQIAEQVLPGDPGNVEARAARFYWGRLFPDFTRQDEADLRNGLLNYGYAVLRAAVARGLVAHGFLPALGLHHAGVQNAFNLADDLLEPFRPFADRLARATWAAAGADAARQLTLDDRRSMTAVLTAEAGLGEERLTVLAAIDLSVAALGRALESGSVDDLAVPSLTEPRPETADGPA